MKMNTLFAAGVIGLMGSTAIASDLTFSEIDVSADLSVIEDAEAAAFWNTLETDLEAALLVLLADQIAEDDSARLVVNVESFALDEPNAPFAVENAALAGRVHVIDLDNNSNFDSFELSVRLEGMRVTTEEGIEIDAVELAPEAIYTTLITAFAEYIASRVD